MIAKPFVGVLVVNLLIVLNLLIAPAVALLTVAVLSGRRRFGREGGEN